MGGTGGTNQCACCPLVNNPTTGGQGYVVPRPLVRKSRRLCNRVTFVCAHPGDNLRLVLHRAGAAASGGRYPCDELASSALGASIGRWSRGLGSSSGGNDNPSIFMGVASVATREAWWRARRSQSAPRGTKRAVDLAKEQASAESVAGVEASFTLTHCMQTCRAFQAGRCVKYHDDNLPHGHPRKCSETHDMPKKQIKCCSILSFQERSTTRRGSPPAATSSSARSACTCAAATR